MQRIFWRLTSAHRPGGTSSASRRTGRSKQTRFTASRTGCSAKTGISSGTSRAFSSTSRAGIKAAFAKYPHIDSLSIDTWAVDYVLLKDGAALLPCHAYRDERTQAVIDEVHQHMPFAELYRRTGIQFQPFNSIYQLYEDAKTGRLQQADDFLMVPEYLLYRLCGVKAREYTNATSTGLVSAATKEYDPEILRALSLPERLFPRLTQPGTVLGQLTPDVAREVGGQTSVVLCATHDTASAVEGLPDGGERPVPLLRHMVAARCEDSRPDYNPRKHGMQLHERGRRQGYIRYLKNIMGLWIVQCIQKQLGISFAEMVNLARTSHYEQIFNVNRLLLFQRAGGHGGGNSRCALSRPGNRRRPLSAACTSRWRTATAKRFANWSA